jgi:hypothetical protein
MHEATEAYGADQDASIVRSSLLSAGPTLKVRGPILARSFYYDDDGKLIYAGRVGTGMPAKVLTDLRRRLDPLARQSAPISAPPPRETRFGSLSRRSQR